MKKFVPFFVILTIALLTSFLTYKLSYLFAEKYFFDEIFYKKSVAHGYRLCEEKCDIKDLEKFGKRAQDVAKLLYSDLKTPSVLGTTTQKPYTIAIIGDSHVWGVGVREEETFSFLLEKQLNQVRFTRILQLGFPGDSALDNFDKYKLAERLYGPDLYIFVLVENDLMFNPEQKYTNPLHSIITNNCQGANKILYRSGQESSPDGYTQLLKDTFSNEQNICVLKEVAMLSPKENAIYFSSSPEFGYMKRYIKILEEEGLQVVRMEEGKKLKAYEKYWLQSYEYLTVSQIEGHPSKIAHRMYADILFENITSNPGFSSNN